MHENNYEFSLASLKELMARDYYSKSLKTMGLCKLVGGTFFFNSNMGKRKGIKLQSNRTTTEKAAKKKTQTGNSKQW